MSESPPAGVLYVVATPIGNLEDMTHRATRILSEVEAIAAEDTRSAGVLLKHFGIRAPVLFSYFEGNEAQRTAQISELLADGKDVALISEAGMPGISDPGARLIQAVIEKGVRVVVVPGAVAAMTALVGSGLDTERFLFLGFAPRAAGARQELFGGLRAESSTMILYEAPDRVLATLEDLGAAFGSERRAVLARELTKLYEEYRRGTIAELSASVSESPPRGECTLVVEGAAGDTAEVDIEAAVRELLKTGLGPKDVAARLVVSTGKPRRQLYQLALSLKRDRDEH